MTTLYRIYGEGKTLLYVGITDNYGARMRQHADKHWWAEVRSIAVTEYATRATAAEAEVEAIVDESPKYNRAHNASGPEVVAIPKPRRKPKPARKFLKLPEAAEAYGVCTKTLRRRIADGSLPASRMGARIIVVAVDDLDALLRPIPSAKMES